MEIESEVISRITPDQEENDRISNVLEKVKAKILAVARAKGLEVEPVLVGSVAKGTHLKDPDVDMFVMFPPSTKREELESNGLGIGMEVLEDYEKKYAEHPYVSGKVDGFNVEIVPCYRIEDPSSKMSAVDRTPFHTSYVIENQKEEQRDQMRLLKQFLIGIGIYGAEAEIEGFSGYLCELLILNYGDFGSLVVKAQEWRKGTTISLDSREHSQFPESLIVVDPVDPSRNVASALSEENFTTFVHACKEYSKNPKIEFFFPNEIIPKSIEALGEMMKRRGTTLLAIAFEIPEVLSDILHSQLRKSKKAMEKLWEQFGFRIISCEYYVDDEALLLFEFEVYSLPSVKLHRGPPVWHSNTSDFLKKWRGSEILVNGPYIIDGYWYVDIERDYTNPKELFEDRIGTMGMGGHIIESIKKSGRIMVGSEVLEKRYAESLTRFYFKKFRWEY